MPAQNFSFFTSCSIRRGNGRREFKKRDCKLPGTSWGDINELLVNVIVDKFVAKCLRRGY